MVAKKAPVKHEPVKLFKFLENRKGGWNTAVAVELAESTGGIFYLFINAVHYNTGKYNKHTAGICKDEVDAREKFLENVLMLKLFGYTEVPNGAELSGFSDMLNYTDKHINNHAQPETVKGEGLRKMLI